MQVSTTSLLRVGVVVPLYNKRTTINRALKSIFEQTVPPATVVVVDDGSTDGSVAAIDPEWRQRIDLVQVPNGGPGTARNLGAARLKTEFLAFLDADDRWGPRFLEAAVARLAVEPACGAFVAAYDLGASAHLQREELRCLFASTGAYEPRNNASPESLKSFIDAMHSSSTVVRSTLFERFGGFYDRDRCVFGEDSWFWIKVALSGPIWFDREKLTHFHVEDSGLGHTRAGFHPRLPAVRFAEELRSGTSEDRLSILNRLLAYYRLLETEALSRRGDCSEIGELRRQLPWPSSPSGRLAARELRVSLYCLRAKLGYPMIGGQ